MRGDLFSEETRSAGTEWSGDEPLFLISMSTPLPALAGVPRGLRASLTPIPAEDLFRQHAAWVGRFLSRLGAEPSNVEDLVQEVFLVAHRKGGYLPGAASPKTWLADIAQYVKSTATPRHGEAISASRSPCSPSRSSAAPPRPAPARSTFLTLTRKAPTETASAPSFRPRCRELVGSLPT